METNLKFKKKGNLWTAQFEATADFNLHIERDNIGSVTIFQRTSSSGGYSQVNNFISPFAKVIDVDIVNSIYPKHYKVVMDSQPTFAVVNSEGEVIFQQNKITAIINMERAQTGRLLGMSFDKTQIDKMFVDGVEITPSDGYSFPAEGEYKVEYVMKKEFNTCYAMFMNCNLITSLDFSSFDTSNVTNMGSMFYYGEKLTTLDLSNFDTSNVTNMSSMFYGCGRLNELNLSNFDTSNVTNMDSAFRSCISLASLDLSHFDMGSCYNFINAFEQMNKLNSFDPFFNWKEGWVTFNNTNIRPVEVHKLIVQASVEEAVQKSLVLNEQSKTNWMNSEYYEADVAMANEKLITIA